MASKKGSLDTPMKVPLPVPKNASGKVFKAGGNGPEVVIGVKVGSERSDSFEG